MKKFILLTAALLLTAMLTALADPIVTKENWDDCRDLPYGMVKIEEDAFRDDATIKSIVIPEGLQSIGANAFAGCTSLEKIAVLNPDVVLGTNALGTSSENKVIWGYKGSTAEAYAAAYGYTFKRIYLISEKDADIKQAILDYADTLVRAQVSYSSLDCITFTRHCYINATWEGSLLKVYIPDSCPRMFNLPAQREATKYQYVRIDSVADLQPGDIICWTDDKYWNKAKDPNASEPGDADYMKCSHVGMYVADKFDTKAYDASHGITGRPGNKVLSGRNATLYYNISASKVFVESSSSAGGVRYNYFTDYYVRNFLCAWRILL